MVNCSKNLSAVIPCDVPDLKELASAIEEGLQKNFQAVAVDISKCPDLTDQPFHMTQKYFGHQLSIAEVGGPGNLFPLIQKEKQFDLKEICSVAQASEGAVFGPGAGPWPHIGVNCEMVADYNCKTKEAATKTAKIVEENGKDAYQMEVIDTSTFSLMANLAVTKNSDEQIDMVHIHVAGRYGQLNFPECIRRAVAAKFPGKTIQEEWLRYFEMSAPLTCTTVMHTHDSGHKLRMEHTHCYSMHGDAGHYHYDVTPDEVEYEAWFTTAEKIYRIDEV